MKNVQFILDEAAMLGPMTAIDDALGIGRAYAVRLQLYYQSIGQLKQAFPEGKDQTVFSNTTQIFFGVNDNATADYVSARLGEETIIVDSGGTGRSSTYQSSWGQQTSQSASHGDSSNQNWQQQARKLLKPEEVIALSPRLAITFASGAPPVCTQLLRYYEEPALFQTASARPPRFSSVKAVTGDLMRLVCTTIILVFIATTAALMTTSALRVWKTPIFSPKAIPVQDQSSSGDDDVRYR